MDYSEKEGGKKIKYEKKKKEQMKIACENLPQNPNSK